MLVLGLINSLYLNDELGIILITFHKFVKTFLTYNADILFW